jgi:hypothetical protein
VADIPTIELTETTLRIGVDEFTLEAVTSVSYLRLVTSASGAVTNLTRRFRIEQPGRTVELKLDGAQVQAEEKQAAWEHLVAISQRQIEPRLYEQAMMALRAGETVRIDKLELSREGFVWRGILRQKRYTWPEFAATSVSRGLIRITVRNPKGQEKAAGDLATESPNAVLVPRLMATSSLEFDTPAGPVPE